jgi:hypothetical protein
MLRNIARNIFIVLAGLNGLIALALGMMLMLNTQPTFEAFGIPYTPELDSFGIAVGALYSLYGLLHGISIAWAIQGKVEGIVIVVAYAVFLVVLGIIDFIQQGTTNILLIDGIRGVLTSVVGFFAYRTMKA